MSIPRKLRCAISNHPTFYHFRVWQASCTVSEGSTVQDLLSDLRRDHDNICGCEIYAEARAWFACYDITKTSTIGLDTSSFAEVPLSAPLVSLSDPVEASPATVHIIFEGKSTGTGAVDKTTIRSKCYKHGSGVISQVPGSPCTLPVAQNTDYSDMRKIPGLLILDKSKFVSPLYTQPEACCLPIIRRPSGFGRTTFLSMLQAWCDGSRDIPHELYSYAYNGSDLLLPDQRPLQRGGCAFVLSLDLSRLCHISSGMTNDVLRFTCRAFLNASATACYERYRDFLQYPARSRVERESTYPQFADYTALARSLLDDIPYIANGGCCDELVTFKDLLGCVEQSRDRFHQVLFISVDNYTDPIAKINRSSQQEDIIASEIFEPIIRALQSGEVYRAFVVGDSDLSGGHLDPYCVNALFNEHTFDLTDEPLLAGAFGFTKSEIIAFGRALFGDDNDFIIQVQIKASCSPQNVVSRSRTTYSTRDVLAFARALQIHPQDPGALSCLTIRTFVSDYWGDADSYCDESQDIDEFQLPEGLVLSPYSSPKSTKRKQIEESEAEDDGPRSESNTSQAQPASSSLPLLAVDSLPRRPSIASLLSNLETKVEPTSDTNVKLLKFDTVSEPDAIQLSSDTKSWSSVSPHVSPQLSISPAPPTKYSPSPTPPGKRRRLVEKS